MDSEELEVNPFFGSFILETLTLGMYEDSRNAIREYVQNAFDAIREARDERLLGKAGGSIRIEMNGENLSVVDDGIGMPSANAGSRLISIGASSKDYRKQAGFRGIGRLSGLVLCNQLRFRTKAAGERQETQVTFDAKGLRDDLLPSNAQAIGLEKLLKKRVKIRRVRVATVEAHYFAVDMLGLHEPPAECISPQLMEEFLGEVAPVGYREEFAFSAKIMAEARRRKASLDSVDIVVVKDGEERHVSKPYGEKFKIGTTAVALEDINLQESPNGYWWGWTSEKAVPGSFAGKEAGIRIRVRNIQIDGTALIRGIFADVPGARSYTRLSDWYLGEIIVSHDDLIPNARRDGFEDNAAWIEARDELVELCRQLGAAAYKLSAKSQVSFPKLAQAMRDLEQTKETLLRDGPGGLDQAVEFAKAAEKLQKKLGKAMQLSGDVKEISHLRRLETRLLNVRNEILSRHGGIGSVDKVLAVKEAEQALLERLVQLFNERLDPGVNEAVMEILEDEFGAQVRRRSR